MPCCCREGEGEREGRGVVEEVRWDTLAYVRDVELDFDTEHSI